MGSYDSSTPPSPHQWRTEEAEDRRYKGPPGFLPPLAFQVTTSAQASKKGVLRLSKDSNLNFIYLIFFEGSFYLTFETGSLHLFLTVLELAV